MVRNHLIDLPRQFFAVQLSVPPPVGGDAVLPRGIDKVGLKRGRVRRRFGRGLHGTVSREKYLAKYEDSADRHERSLVFIKGVH